MPQPKKATRRQRLGRYDPAAVAYSVEETAGLLKLHVNTVYAACRRGEIPTVKIGKRWLIPKLALDQMLARAAPTMTTA
jgi:excisionase family DNA binding protein